MTGSFTVASGELAAAVKYVAHWLPHRPTVPIWAGILGQVDGDRLDLFSFNEATTGRATVQIDGDASGAPWSFVVSGRILDSLCGVLGAKAVRFTEEGADIVMTAGKFRATLPTMSVEDYPYLPGLASTVGQVDGDALAAAVDRVTVAAGRDETLGAHWLGMYFAWTDDELTLAASDRYRVTREVLDWTPLDVEAFTGVALPPAAVLADAAAGFAGQDVTVGCDLGAFSLSTPWRSLTTRLLELDKFPHQQIRPMVDMSRDTEVTFSVKAAREVLRRIGLFRNVETDAVTLTARAGALEFAADAGEAAPSGDDEIEAEYEGEEVALRARAKALQDALSTTPGDRVTLSFVADPGARPKPALFASSEHPNWRHVIVPLANPKS